MIYQVRVFSPEGKLRRIVSSKTLTRKSLKEALSRVSRFTAFPLGSKNSVLLKKWQEFNNMLEGISVGRSER